MSQVQFEARLLGFFSNSAVPRALWQRLLDRETSAPTGIVEIPGRVVFAIKAEEESADVLAFRKNIGLVVLISENRVILKSRGEVLETLELIDFKSTHLLLSDALTPPSRTFRVVAARELAETTAGLVNKLVLSDPNAKSQPSSWLPLALDLMRLGASQALTGTFFIPSEIQSSTSNGQRIAMLNDLLEQIPSRNGAHAALLPDWTDPVSLEMAISIINANYSSMSATALGAYLHRLGNATGETGIWGYFADGNSIRALITPLFDEIAIQSDAKSSVEGLTRYVFVDPTDSPGSILTEIIESLAENLIAEAEPNLAEELLRPERFVPWVSNELLGMVNALAIWFALARAWRELGRQIDQQVLQEIWARLKIEVGNQLDGDWASVKSRDSDLIAIVGSPRFVGANRQGPAEKLEVERLFGTRKVDYSACWLKKGSELVMNDKALAAFIITNSVTQGEQVGHIWPKVLSKSVRIAFARPSIKWSAKADAGGTSGVSVVIVGLAAPTGSPAHLYVEDRKQAVDVIGPYLVPNVEQIVVGRTRPISNLPRMVKGNMPFAESLLFDQTERDILQNSDSGAMQYVRKLVGSKELARSSHRYCIWITNESDWADAQKHPFIRNRVEQSRTSRMTSTNPGLALTPWRFREITQTEVSTLVVPSVTSESRDYIPIVLVGPETIVSNLVFAVYEAPDWLFALLNSRTHQIWLRLVSGGLETRLRYSNRLSYNTFPTPELSEDQKQKLRELGSEIVDARGPYPEIPIGDLYSSLPVTLKRAHESNDEFVASIYGITDAENVEMTTSVLMSLYKRGLALDGN